MACERTAVPPAAQESGSPDQQNVLLISLDTTRADALGCYGSTKGATRNVDQLAERGARFESVFAPVPLTLPSHTTMLTGLDPPRHTVRDNSVFDVPQAATTLAEVLLENGYRTFAAVSSIVLLPRHRLDQGFQVYDTGGISLDIEGKHTRPAGEIAELGLAQMQGSEPFFGFLHFYDPHQPYEPPAEYASRYPGSPEELYFAELAYADDQIQRLVENLTRSSRIDRTLVVVTADHGEGRGEHGEQTHGSLLHDATQRIPLILHHPSLPHGLVVKDAVSSLADLMPTILQFLEIPCDVAFDGRSLLPLLRGEKLEPRPAYLETLTPRYAYEWSPLFGIRRPDFKLVEGARARLFDLKSDPQESIDVAERNPELVEQLRAELKQLRQGRGEALEVETRTLSIEETHLLGTIGYAAGDPESASPDPQAPDPYDHIQAIDEYARALVLMEREEHARARPILERLVADFPRTFVFHQSLAAALGKLGEPKSAIEECSKALSIRPDSVEVLTMLATAAYFAGLPEECEGALLRAIQIPSCPASAYLQLWEIYRQGRDPGLATQILEALEARVSSMPAAASFQLAEILIRQQRKPKARKILEALQGRSDVSSADQDRAQRMLSEL